MTNSKIFWKPAPKKDAVMRLFCFPYAGGSANIYLPWVKEIPEEIELVLIQPPGRGSRIIDVPHNFMDELVGELMEEYEIFLDKPCVFFGHSLGSRVAFELCCELSRRKHKLPEYFIASASRAPHLKSDRELDYLKSDALFKKELEQLNGTPKVILENDEIMELLLPALKADFSIADGFCSSARQLQVPMMVLTGTDDDSSNPEQVLAWKELTSEYCEFIDIFGDHFFIDSEQDQVLKLVKKVLSRAHKKAYFL